MTYRNRPLSDYKKPLPQKNIAKKNTLAFATYHPTKREREQGHLSALWHIHTDGNLVVAADGFRLHMSDNLSDNTTCDICANSEQEYPDFSAAIPNKFDYRFTFNALEFRRAVVSCGNLAREGSDVVRLYFYQDKMVVESSFEDNKSEFEVSLIEDIGQGNGFMIAFNYKFLIDAIDHCSLGSGNVTVSAYRTNSPILMSGSTKTNNKAVIMPMYLG